MTLDIAPAFILELKLLHSLTQYCWVR